MKEIIVKAIVQFIMNNYELECEISKETTFNDLKMSEVQVRDLIAYLEVQFGVKLSVFEIEQYVKNLDSVTVSDLVGAIYAKKCFD